MPTDTKIRASKPSGKHYNPGDANLFVTGCVRYRAVVEIVMQFDQGGARSNSCSCCHFLNSDVIH
jgi:hypothetical protein